MLKAEFEGESFSLGKRSPLILRIARALTKGTTSDKPIPAEEPAGLLEFAIDGSKYEVKLWQDDFTYNGQLYRLKDVYTAVRLILNTP
jgi:hypothetical protein